MTNRIYNSVLLILSTPTHHIDYLLLVYKYTYISIFSYILVTGLIFNEKLVKSEIEKIKLWLMMIKKPKEPNIHIFFLCVHSLLFSLEKQNKVSHENGIETELESSF